MPPTYAGVFDPSLCAFTKRDALWFDRVILSGRSAFGVTDRATQAAMDFLADRGFAIWAKDFYAQDHVLDPLKQTDFTAYKDRFWDIKALVETLIYVPKEPPEDLSAARKIWSQYEQQPVRTFDVPVAEQSDAVLLHCLRQASHIRGLYDDEDHHKPWSEISGWERLKYYNVYFAQLTQHLEVREIVDIMERSDDLVTPISILPPALDFMSFSVAEAAKTTTLDITIRALPAPSDGVPWDDVLAFRNDPDTRNQLERLRRWTRSAALKIDAGTPPQIIEDELTAMIEDYTAHVRLLDKKHTLTTWETLIALPLSILQNMARLKFDALVREPFKIARSKVDLAIAMEGAPGREAAYIAMAQKRFA